MSGNKPEASVVTTRASENGVDSGHLGRQVGCHMA